MLTLTFEYVCKFLVVLTSCVIVFLAAGVYVGWIDTKKNIDVKDLVIIAGIGFSAASGSYFRPLRGRGNSS